MAGLVQRGNPICVACKRGIQVRQCRLQRRPARQQRKAKLDAVEAQCGGPVQAHAAAATTAIASASWRQRKSEACV